MLIKEIKTGKILTKPKFYKLINVDDSSDVIYAQSLKELSTTLGSSIDRIMVVVRKQIPIKQKMSGKSYFITKHY